MSETEKKTQQTKKAPGKRSLLDDKRFRMPFAILLAVAAWVLVTMVIQPNTTTPLYGVPVNFSYDSSKYTTQGLSIVNSPSYNVTLKVSGNGSVIGGLTKDDFLVYPDYSSVKTSGAASLKLNVKCTAETAGSVSVSVQPKNMTVDVVFDTVEEKVVPITVMAKDLKLADGYTLYKTTAAPGEVTLSGPTSELENVTQAIAEVTADGELDDSVTVNTTLKFADAEGNEVPFTYVTADNETADVTLTVYKLAELPLRVDFVNTPDGFDDSILKYSLSQNTLQVAGPASVIDAMSEISVGSIDVSTFSLNKVYELPITLPGGLVSQENIASVTVSFDTTGLSTKTLNLPATSVQVVNLPSTYRLTVKSDRIQNVTLCGPADVLSGLTAANVIARIDADELSITTGQQNIAVSIYVPSSGKVFAVGTYTVQCQIESK
ncbi:MAG: CdaR family protein [Faecalibacterium sp.]|nr:CdaR family protein [Faecalibacterium sp.]